MVVYVVNSVVICLKISIFVVATTTIKKKANLMLVL